MKPTTEFTNEHTNEVLKLKKHVYYLCDKLLISKPEFHKYCITIKRQLNDWAMWTAWQEFTYARESEEIVNICIKVIRKNGCISIIWDLNDLESSIKSFQLKYIEYLRSDKNKFKTNLYNSIF